MKNPHLISSIDDLISNLEKIESYINEFAHEEEFEEMSNYIRRGHNFVAYRIGEEIHFAPSRFVGYRNNTLNKHRQYRSNHLVTGTETDRMLSSNQILNQDKKYDSFLEQKYHEFCTSLNVNPTRVKPKFWYLNQDLISEFGETPTFFEGSVKIQKHKRIERNSKVVRLAKQHFKDIHGSLYCEICGLNFEKVYGLRGKDFIEAHHVIPISEFDNQNHEVKVSDFIMVCPNCHSMLHKQYNGNVPSVSELKKCVK